MCWQHYVCLLKFNEAHLVVSQVLTTQRNNTTILDGESVRVKYLTFRDDLTRNLKKRKRLRRDGECPDQVPLYRHYDLMRSMINDKGRKNSLK